jgi:large subunit ribosomal protein L22
MLRNVRISPRKARIVVDLIRNKSVEDAANILQFTTKKVAPMLTKLLESAIHNVDASEELDWDVDDLVVAQVYVDEGPTMRRFRPRAMGRATPIRKRTSHITLVLEPRS